MIGRRAWFYREQEAICYLAITPLCQKRGAQMDFSRPHPTKTPKAYATWDHIFPKGQRRGHEGRYQMLACYACNNARGNAPPKPEHIAIAQDLWERWFAAHQNYAAAAQARKKLKQYDRQKKHEARQRERLQEMQKAMNTPPAR